MFANGFKKCFVPLKTCFVHIFLFVAQKCSINQFIVMRQDPTLFATHYKQVDDGFDRMPSLVLWTVKKTAKKIGKIVKDSYSQIDVRVKW